MSEGRNKVLGAVRAALAQLGESRAELPEFDDSRLVAEGRLADTESLLEGFEKQFSAVHGRTMHELAELIDLLRCKGWTSGCCDPDLRQLVGEPLEKAGLSLEYGYQRENYERYDFGITIGSGAIAESGTIVLNDEQTFDRLAALTPWVHIVVLRANQLVRTVADAIGEFGASGNIVWCTGPSKTADIEGILIEGVHGPGEQVALFVDH